MAIKNIQGKWRVDVRPNGAHGRRYRRTFDTKGEAVNFEAWIIENHRARADWEPARIDGRRLSHLITEWYELHGAKLRDGPGRLAILSALAAALGDPPARLLTASDFTRYANKRLQGGNGKAATSPATINNELSYLRAVYNRLTKLDTWPHGNPLAKLDNWHVPDRELAYLTAEQIETVLAECRGADRNRDVALCAELCLDTGARWREAERLKLAQVGKGRVSFLNTKSGKPRAVPITGDLEKRLRAHGKAAGREDGRIFGPCHAAFEKALRRTGIPLPRGQKAHVLRHTFASHYMMNGGNILALQKILGHHSVTMTEKYAHLAPDYFEEVLRLKPIRELTK